ncbi:MAG TPA: glycosyl hydrolase family 28-related protein, partial [Vicinamibacteria bacterium]|nr:glycosyl hydrolase family 28-related protein [Vicinamibacteria bacterium]
MPRAAVVAALALFCLAPAAKNPAPTAPGEQASYYTVRPDDPRAVEVTRERFGATGDGVADDTAAVQKAIDTLQEESGEGVVLLPAGRYRLSATLYVWPGIRLIGYGVRRPV